MASRPNRLAHEQSPYLLQHQNNPVDWYPWGEEAFAEARAQDKPIFLSIGYSTCHWCHVMEHESFEDPAVAALMNRAFVSIKVDREERPDIDTIYMSVCQLMGAHCGWPLNVLLTPDRLPFYVATYLPKHTRHGRMGMVDFVPRIEALWRERRGEIDESAEALTTALAGLQSAGDAAGEAPGAATLRMAFNQFSQRYDPEEGGFGRAPKFPSPHNLLFLLRYGRRTGEAAATRMVVHTLERIRLGGIYDHLGYGVHRYATDATWKLPHFEKMLYDQALLVMAYTEAFLATGTVTMEQTAREIITYVQRDLMAPEGAFHSAEDADSEGREGTFYLWSLPELEALLDPEEVALLQQIYHVEPDGNFLDEATREKTGENILHLTKPLSQHAEDTGAPPFQLIARLEAIRTQLFEHRAGRIRPDKDDKVLTDWNGLMLAALAKAGRAFQEPAYLAAARRVAGFLLGTMRQPDGRLLHRYRQGEAAIEGVLDDYAFLTWGLIELYQATFEADLLQAALDLQAYLMAHFWDEADGGFFFTADDAEALIVRTKEMNDGALPSGNAIAMWNLLRLARLTGRTDLEAHAATIASRVGAAVAKMPFAYAGLLIGQGFALGPSYEVVVAGDPEAADTRAMLAALQARYLPNVVVVLRPPEGGAITALAPYTAAYTQVDGLATAYVCSQFVCQAPTTDVAQMLELLGQG